MLEPYNLVRIVRNSSNCEFSCEYLKFSLKNNLNGIQAPPEIHLTHRLDNWYPKYFTILLSSNPTYKDYHFLSYRFNLMASLYQRFQLLILLSSFFYSPRQIEVFPYLQWEKHVEYVATVFPCSAFCLCFAD